MLASSNVELTNQLSAGMDLNWQIIQRERYNMMKEVFDQGHLRGENGHLLLDCVTGIQTIGLQKGSNKRMISSHVTYHWKFLHRHNMIEHQGKIHILHQNSYLINPHLQMTKGFQVGLAVAVVLITKGKGAT